MSTLPILRFSAAEYLARERASSLKHEYYQGEIFAMADAWRQHNEISINLSTWLRSQLRHQPCRPYAGDMRYASLLGSFTPIPTSWWRVNPLSLLRMVRPIRC